MNEAPINERLIEPYARVTSRERILAASEVLLGAAVVIGHNVYHKVPNEVPILDATLLASLLLRRKSWRSVGLGRPSSWKWTALLGISGGACLQLKDILTEPLAHLFWQQPEKVSSIIRDVHQHPSALAKSLVVVWTFAALGEEFGYRALLLRRTADALNGSLFAYATAALVSSILFGFGHFYKGPTGIFDSTVSGLILAAVYLLARRNIWAAVIAHGLSDTFALIFTYFTGPL